MKKFLPHGNPENKAVRKVVETRKPLYIVQILDTSGSMAIESTVIGEDGVKRKITNIEQLNQGMKLVIKSLRKFERENVLYKIYFQIIELNSYGKALFPEFMPVSANFEEVRFEAEGWTSLENSLTTLTTYINHRYMPGYNKALSVILMSDGYPTDSNGYESEQKAYERVIDKFKSYLEKNNYTQNVDLYSIAVGDDACEEMLKYFSGEDNFFFVGESESIADKLDFVTRQTLARHTTQDNFFEDDEDEDDDSGLLIGGQITGDDEDDNEFEDEDDHDDSEDDNEFDDEDDHDDSEDDNDEDDHNQDVYVIDILKCKKDQCRLCIPKCPEKAIHEKSGIVVIDSRICTGCGECVQYCPYSAITKDSSDDDLDDLLDF